MHEPGSKTNGRAVPSLHVVSRLPAPYREPLFQRIHDSSRIRISVLYQYLGRSGTAWGEERTGLEGAFSYPSQAICERPRGVVREVAAFFRTMRLLRRRRPDLLLIHGYSYTASWAAMAACWWWRIPYALRGDSNGFIETGMGRWKGLKRRLLGRLVSGASAILHIGAANRRYWESYGARQDQLVEARYAVDEHVYKPRARNSRQTDAVRLLFVGRLIPRKRVMCLVEAFIRLAEEEGSSDCTLTIVGTGPDWERLKARVDEWGGDGIVLRGRSKPCDLPAIYQDHDVLVCPYESEPWGLTINEAMSCGLAVVAATNGTCGAAMDLVRDGVNGAGLAAVDEHSILDALRRVLADRGRLQQMKDASLKLIEDWRYDSAVRGFCEATERSRRGGDR